MFLYYNSTLLDLYTLFKTKPVPGGQLVREGGVSEHGTLKLCLVIDFFGRVDSRHLDCADENTLPLVTDFILNRVKLVKPTKHCTKNLLS